MDYKNDERYWNINLLNKWFFIGAAFWTLTMVWMFIDDNDDEFKYWQKEYYKILKDKTEQKYDNLYSEVSNLKEELEANLNSKRLEYESKQDMIQSFNDSINSFKDKYSKVNIDFKAKRAEADVAKYLVEKEKASKSYDENSEITLEYYELKRQEDYLKKQKENLEISITSFEKKIEQLNVEVKEAQDIRDKELMRLDLLENQLISLDRNRMTLGNQIADVFRDLPIVDFLDPKLKIQQTVVPDVKYDVNFAKVATVDRCVSCHMGIENPDFADQEQPYTAHPHLDLMGLSSSPHPFSEFGCTSCHSGRSRGTGFSSSVHMPHTKEQLAQWEEEHDWHLLHHWLQPMLPSEYSQAGCYKCHTEQPYLEGGDKLQLGISLIHQKGCNACHLIESMPKNYNVGPDLTKINQKFDKEWAFKWIRNPQSFRYDTHMPHFYGQSNNSSPDMIARNDAEIYAMTEFLYKNKEEYVPNNNDQFLGDLESGAKLFNAVGCMGCHKINEESVDYIPETEEYEFYLSNHGYGQDEPTNYNLLNQQGPNLIGIGSKLSAEWLFKWLKNPKNYWEKTRMPNLRLSDQEAKDITAYLLSFKNEDFENQQSPELSRDYFDEELESIALGWLNKSFNYVDAEDAFNQMKNDDTVIDYVADKAIRYYGCYTCHNIDGYQDAKPIGAELSKVGSKPLNKFDFGHVHDLMHTNFAWMNQKLANPRIYDRDKIVAPEDKARMPNFYLNQIEIEAITTALLGLTETVIEPTKLADLDKTTQELAGYKLIRQYNCYGCHEIYDEGGKIADSIKDIMPEELQAEHRNYAPPSLYAEGAKVQSDWLFSYLEEPITIRPNLQVRMPSFNLSDDDWNAIIAAFKDMEDNTLSYESIHIVDKDSEKYRQGFELVSDYGYYDLEADQWVDAFNEGSRCYVCHFQGDVPPGKDYAISDPLVWAPNLALSKERLRPEWVKEWLRNPQHYMEYTKMVAPALYNKCPECLDGNLTSEEFNELRDVSDNKDNPNWRATEDADYRLEAITDWIFGVEGKLDISDVIEDYFLENGYKHFEEEESDEDDWGDDDW